jgi:Ca2+-binding EF-hand superfamily protein
MGKGDDYKSIFNLYDDDCEGKIDAFYIGHVARACGLKPTNEQVAKAAGAEYKKMGEKKLTYEEWLPIFEKLKKEKDAGTFADYMEGLKVFDKEETGKILAAEVKHVLMALGERLTAAEVEEVMDGVADAEGMIDYAAFIKKVMAGPFPKEEE